MNGTCWTTLSQFVQSLGNSGVCEIEESERVFFFYTSLLIGLVYYFNKTR